MLAGAHSSLATFLLVAVLRLVAADPWHFLLGRHGGEEVTGWAERRSPRAGRALARTRRMVARVGVAAVAVRPCGPVMAAAGACRLSPLRVAAANMAGTVAYVMMTYAVGRAAASPLDGALERWPTHVLALGVVALGLAAVLGRRRWRRSVDGKADPGSGPDGSSAVVVGADVVDTLEGGAAES